MNQIIKPGATIKLTVEISCTKKIILTDEDKEKIKGLIRLYLKGKMQHEK